MPYDESIEATFADLGEVGHRFFDYVRSDSEAFRPFDYRTAFAERTRSEWGVGCNEFPLQPWPVLIGERKRTEIERATIGIAELVRSIPERLLGNDPLKVSQVLGIGDELLAMLLLEPPTGLGQSIARCDFVDTVAGLKCMELNMGGNIGGWDLRFWKDICLENPTNKRFFEKEGICPRFRDPIRFLFRHVVNTARHLATEGSLNIAFVVDDFEMEKVTASSGDVNGFYCEVIREMDLPLAGKVVFDSYPGRLATRSGTRLYHGETRIHALVECCTTMTPEETFRCFKAETLKLFNSPISHLLRNKRLLGLLSENEESGVFDRAEQAFLRAHVPWSREVTDRETSFRGERAAVPELLRVHKDELVIKKGFGAHGTDVHLGRFKSELEWDRLVEKAVRERDWVAQEFVESRPYLFPDGENGPCPHAAVWGTFVFGDLYGGAFLRTIARDKQTGPINSQQGAIEAFVFEV